MFLIRQSQPKDVPTLLKLARMVYFINLPPNEAIIATKIEQAKRAFIKAGGGKVDEPKQRGKKRPGGSGLAAMDHHSDLFMFTMEDTETGEVIGTSQIRAHQGGPGNPNWAMQISTRTFKSDPLSFSSAHQVGKLFGDETGPSEIGGLIIQPSYRGHAARPGRLLSFIRFHFIGLHRNLFAERILAEMMAPVTSDGDNAFWDHFGRKFIPVKYAEADRFCQHNRTFIPELLPREEIYLSLFPLEVQNQVGQVSADTVPARKLLESMGFRYRGFIDPFDGGPHLDAATGDVPLVRSTCSLPLGEPADDVSLAAGDGDQTHGQSIISLLRGDGEFRAVEAPAAVVGGVLLTTPEACDALGARKGDRVGFTPIDWQPGALEPAAPERTARPARSSRLPAKKKTRSKAGR